jgi:hypothetical protein
MQGLSFFSLISAFLFFAQLLALPARAEPIATIKTKLITASVEIDDRLKSWPGLYEDCLAEGRKWLATSRADAEKEQKKNPDMFSDGFRWEYQRGYALRAPVGRYVSLVRNDESSGGAHPNRYTDTILWDSAAKKRIGIRPFFTETADGGPTLTVLAKFARAAVAAQKRERGIDVAADPDQDQELQAIKPKLIGLGPVSLAPSTEKDKSSGLTIHYSPYAVGAYVEGEYTVFVPWNVLKPYLSPEGLAIFGGRRPKSDEKEWP